MGRNPLWIQATMGAAGDMFSAALIGLGAPEQGVLKAMRIAADLLGGADVEVGKTVLTEGLPARRIHVDAPPREPLSIAEAPGHLEEVLQRTEVRGGYAGFAHRALAVLSRERG